MNKVLTLILAAVLVVLAGCSAIPQKPYETTEEITTPDGTVYPSGSPVYVDEEGNPTLEASAPDGTLREPLMEDDVERLDMIVTQAEEGASKIPYGIGGILGLLVGWLGKAGVDGLRRKRRLKRKKVQDKLKGKSKGKRG